MRNPRKLGCLAKACNIEAKPMTKGASRRPLSCWARFYHVIITIYECFLSVLVFSQTKVVNTALQ
jgi:hypothetical protein